MSEFDIILDSSRQNLQDVPPHILKMCCLKMLYLQQNCITELPENFFVKLPQLSWLDLRNNELVTLPETIAHHQHLENLLLSNNKIEVLPNVLGTLSKLKVLQIANNPLIYPNRRIVAEGTRSICSYLKNKYEKISRPPSAETVEETKTEGEITKEKEVRVVVDYSKDFMLSQESLHSSLIVKGISKAQSEEGRVHKISNGPPNTILLKSYYNDDKYVKATTQTSYCDIVSTESMRQVWMNKLKQLLEDQERILQQERNLQALSSWRLDKKTEPIRQVNKDTRLVSPFATYPQYDSAMTREDMRNEIDKLIKHNMQPPKKETVEHLINDLIGQLKDMEVSYEGFKSPRSEIESAGTQIMKIMEIHRKLLKLQQTNDLTLQ